MASFKRQLLLGVNISTKKPKNHPSFKFPATIFPKLIRAHQSSLSPRTKAAQ